MGAKTGRPAGVVTDVRAEVEARWARGESAREIADAVGWKAKNPNAVINTYRRRGWKLPHRHSRRRVEASRSARWDGDAA
jgi:hypothetical protein